MQRVVTSIAEAEDAVQLTTRSKDGVIREHRLTQSPAHFDEALAGSGFTATGFEWCIVISSFVVSYVLAAAGALLFRHGNRQTVPVLMSLFFLIGSVATFNAGLLQSLDLGELRRPAQTLAWSLFIAALLLFPNGRFTTPAMKWVMVLLAAMTPFGLSLIPFSVWLPIHTGFFVVAVGALIVRYRKLPAGSERQQIRWALLGFAAGAFLMVPVMPLELVILSSPVSSRIWVWSVMVDIVMGGLLYSAIAGGLLVSLLKYRLYDADALISRSVSLGALTILLLAVFAGTEKIIELLGEEWFGEDLGVLAGGIGAALAAAMIVPLHHRLTHWAEHRFQKQLIRLKHGLPLLVGDMRETAPVARIAAAVLDSVSHGVRASRAALVMDGALVDARGIERDEATQWLSAWAPAVHDGLDCDRSDVVFPMRIPLEADGHGRVGWLLLGPRPDGSFYGKDERETLAAIADPIARGLEIATHRAEREGAQAELNAQIGRTLTAIDTKLDLLTEALQTVIRPEKAAGARVRTAAVAVPGSPNPAVE
jgi:hypothetical protein